MLCTNIRRTYVRTLLQGFLGFQDFLLRGL